VTKWKAAICGEYMRSRFKVSKTALPCLLHSFVLFDMSRYSQHSYFLEDQPLSLRDSKDD
jgi:hypothetical protein